MLCIISGTETPNEDMRLLLNGCWRNYSLFGTVLTSDFPFVNCLVGSTNVPELAFTCLPTDPLPDSWRNQEPFYVSRHRTPSGQSRFYFYRSETCDIMRFTDIADFYLWPRRIVGDLLDPTNDWIEIFLLGAVLSFWLERQEIAALHSSAVVIRNQAVGFLSRSGGGKSVLSAALVQIGYPLLTDDILPIVEVGEKFIGRPGYPQMRMWTDEAQHFLGYCGNLERVHPDFAKYRVPIEADRFGTFCATPTPLVCLYVPERYDSATSRQIEITPISPRNAAIELMRHSFLTNILDAVGWQPRRLAFFTRLVQQIPMRRLRYPSGFEHLPAVREAILEDLARSTV